MGMKRVLHLFSSHQGDQHEMHEGDEYYESVVSFFLSLCFIFVIVAPPERIYRRRI